MRDLDPKRWKDDDDAPARMREVVRAGRDVPKMPDEVRAAVLAALPVSPPVAAPGAPPAAAPSKLLPTPLGMGVGAAAIVAAVAVIVWLARSEPKGPEVVPPTTPSAAATASATAEASSPPPAAVSATLETAAIAPTVVPTVPSPSSASRRLTPPRSSSSVSPQVNAQPAPAGDTLAEESALVGRARRDLRANPSATLSAVDEHATRFPRGELAPEREYLRISALRRLDRVDDARRFARTYVAMFPSSPHAAAVRAFLAESAP
jgi:hypothetical protein